jgi:hypothetical protein
MSIVDCPAERALSVRVFGNRHKLELLVALAGTEDDGVNLSELGIERDVPPSVYYAPMRDFIEAGLVEKVPRVSGERRRWYRRSRHRFWEHAPELLRELARSSVPGAGQRSKSKAASKVGRRSARVAGGGR